MLRSFTTDETGAITVDWVVISSGVVGVSFAVIATVSGGLESLSGETAAELNGMEIQTRFRPTSTLLSNDFSNGLGGWVGGTLANLVGFGEVLQLGPGELAETTFAVPDGAGSATITFDMLGVDDLSGEAASIMINGQLVSLYADNHGSVTHTDEGVSGISVSVDQLYTNEPAGAGSHGHDSRATYTITIDNPGETVTLGVASGTGQPITEEFFAIDDVNFEAS